MLRIFTQMGICEDYEPWLKERIHITNKTFLLLMLVVTLNIINSSVNSVPLVITYLVLSYPLGILAEILIYARYHVAGRVLLSVVPVLVASILQGTFQNNGGEPNAASWGYVILFQIMPFVLLAPWEKMARRIAIGINLFIAIAYELFNQLLEVEKPIALKPEQIFISMAISIVMILGLMWSIDGIFNHFQKGTQSLVDDLENEREDQRNAQEKLNKTLEELNAAHQADEKQNWINSSFADLLSLMRRETESSRVYDLIVPFLVKAVNANQAGLFIYYAEENELRLTSAYAYERKKYIEKKIQSGEGLVWECFLEKSNIILTQVPNQYVTITSGLGEATPGFIMLLPLKNNSQVEGVLELASFKPFNKYQIDYLNKAGEALGSFIANQRISAKTKMLLEQSQAATEKLRQQDEEMRQNVEELSATQEEMMRKNGEIEKLFQESLKKEAELNEKLNEIESIKEREKKLIEHSLEKSEEHLNHINNYRKTLLGILDQLPHKIFLKDEQGKMVIVNTVVAQAHNMSPEELIGKSDFDFVDAKTAQEWRDQELEIVRQGSSSYMHTDYIGGKPRQLRTTKSAFFIPHLNQTGLLGIQTEVQN